jgi:hypothetical protein
MKRLILVLIIVGIVVPTNLKTLTPFEIEAKTLEEAKQKAIDFHKKGETENISWEYNPEFNENMSVIDNGGQSTEEIYCYEDVNMIWANGKE